MKKIVTLLILLACSTGITRSQVNFIFLAEVYGRTIDGLGNFQVQNLSSQAQTGRVQITVRENISKSQVLVATTQTATLQRGMSAFPPGSYINGNFNFGNNPIASIVNQTRNFPPGEYTFCYEFVPTDKAQDGSENCFDATIQPISPLNLLVPAENDKICQKRPPLSWQPPIPYSPLMRFRLLLSEKKEGEAVENLLTNLPLIFLDQVQSTTINYPSTAPDLKEGSTYVWQVIAYQNGVVLSSSEIWEFTVQCSESVKPAPNDSYRELKSLVNGNYYVATRFLKFSFQNSYNINQLNYGIYDTQNGNKKIAGTSPIKIVTGLNKVDIDLTDLGLIDGSHYILKVQPFNEAEVQIRFIYHENEPNLQ